MFTTGTHTIGIDDTVEGTAYEIGRTMTQKGSSGSTTYYYQAYYSGVFVNTRSNQIDSGLYRYRFVYFPSNTVTAMTVRGFIINSMFYLHRHPSYTSYSSNWSNCVTSIKKCTNIGTYSFQYYNGDITEVQIDSVENNNWYFSFNSCTTLNEITVPDVVIDVTYAFNGCTSLTTITMLPTTPPRLGASLSNVDSLTKIYVPAGSLNAYKSATNWSTYADLMEEIQ